MITTGRHRVLQVHPTLRCNLRCLHCYSESGPDRRGGELPVPVLEAALSDAHAHGYTVAGFSGGEPLLYTGLPQVLAHARALGMTTTVTSNGMLLGSRRLEPLREVVSLLAISVDGVPTSHDRMRDRAGAFEAMRRNLPAVRDSGIPFGFIFTLTQHNVHELDWVATFAIEQGARLLQVHPLEETGRAARALQGGRPDSMEMGMALAEARRVEAETAGQLVVHVDVASIRALRRLADEPPSSTGTRLADVVSPLVIEADGTVVPLQFGFARAFALGRLGSQRLDDMAAGWLAEQAGRYRTLFATAADTLDDTASVLPLVNPYDVLTEVSTSTVTVPAAAATRSASGSVPRESSKS